MSSNDLILNWLNEELKSQPNIKDIAKEFSNGYKFAIVLRLLNEISLKELKEFKDSKNIEEIKNNFTKLKNILHDKLNLDIRQEEFKDVINHNISTATIILYKIKNSINKKKINFINIETFSKNPTKEEINKKVLKLLDNDLSKEINQEEDIINKKPRNNRYYLKKINQKTNDLNSIESDSNEFIISDKNIQNKLYEDNEKRLKITGNLNIYIQNSNLNKNKKNSINIYKKNLFNKSTNNNSTNKIFNSINNNTFKTNNINDTFESKIEQLTFNTMETMYNNDNNNTISNIKRNLKPFSGSFNFKNIKMNTNNYSKINALPKILPKINTNTNLDYKSSIMNSNVWSLSNNSIFNKKINYLSMINEYNSDNNNDFNNDYGMIKIKELNNKSQNKLYDNDTKMQEKIENELEAKKEYEVKEKYRLDFIDKKRNPLYKFTKYTGINLYNKANSKYN